MTIRSIEIGRRRLIAGIIIACLHLVVSADVPNAARVNNLVRDILLGDFIDTPKSPSESLKQTLRNYDLEIESNEVMNRIASRPEFVEFRRKRNLTSDHYKGLGMERKVQVDDRVRPDN